MRVSGPSHDYPTSRYMVKCTRPSYPAFRTVSDKKLCRPRGYEDASFTAPLYCAIIHSCMIPLNETRIYICNKHLSLPELLEWTTGMDYWNGLLLKSYSKSYSFLFYSKGAAVALVQWPWRLGASASTQRRLQEVIDIIQKSRT